jgi:hypothetical protein
MYYHTFNQYKYMVQEMKEGVLHVGIMDEEMWKENHLQSLESLIGNYVTVACAARCNSDQSTLLDKWNEGGRLRHLADKRSTLFVAESDSSTAEHEAISTLEDPDEGKDSKDQRGPVDKARVSLVSEDGPERPGDGDGSGEITLGGGESIGGCCSLQKEANNNLEYVKDIYRVKHLQGEEDENFGPDACTVSEAVDTEGIESGDDDKNGGPAVVKREGEVNEELIGI